MRYFLLAYTLIIVMVIGIFGFRGQKFSERPIRIFPDMDEQDYVKAQKPSLFFQDGMGARKPVVGTIPRGFEANAEDANGYGFTNGVGYYHTGQIDGTYGTGMPEELGLTAENTAAFLRRGQERFNISCLPCHGEAGDGNGIVAKIGITGVANLKLESFGSQTYPDGQMFDVIAHGKGLMSGYAANISTRDRWAIIGYVRALQTAANESK